MVADGVGAFLRVDKSDRDLGAVEGPGEVIIVSMEERLLQTDSTCACLSRPATPPSRLYDPPMHGRRTGRAWTYRVKP